MNISRDDDFVSGSAYGHDHRHDGAARSLDGKERVVGSECFSRQILRLFDYSFRRVQIVERLDVD